MENEVKMQHQFVELHCCGQDLRLAYDFNEICDAERLCGCNLLAGLENLDNLGAAQFRGLLYAALKPAHPIVTLQEVGTLIRLDTVLLITTAMAQAYQLALDNPGEPDLAEGAGNPVE